MAGKGFTDIGGAIMKNRKQSQAVEFAVAGEYVELNQLLKLVGVVDSGGAGKAVVASGEVFVDGKLETRKTCKIRPGQVVTLGDVRIKVVAS